MTTLSTARLTLRPWREADLGPFAELNADPEVMQFMPARLSREQSDALASHAAAALAARRFGLWALELQATAEFLGYVGLAEVGFTAHFTPCREVLWRLKRLAWGHGYATAATRACLTFAFATLRAPEVVAFTVPRNSRSRAVMERLGMHHDPAADFEHPRLPEGHPLRAHVLYRIASAEWPQQVHGSPLRA
ncbi:MAG TPA: GNAT family N-acetyltransferase [Steroidobacteraceae bacterium]|jgi:RimJ/RimL family protein N-acetyltransferase|nr:GNAT family N-acetyltransferase [Steroidobacteraceae bacterium]